MPTKTTKRRTVRTVKKPSRKVTSRNKRVSKSSKKHPLHKRILRHLTQRGFARPKLIPALVVLAVAGVGSYFLVFSKANTASVTGCVANDAACAYYSKEGQMNMFYMAVLGRPADKGGLEGWLTAGNASPALAAEKLLGSGANEAKTAVAMTADQFIDHVYQKALGRAADAAGKAGWKAKMPQNSVQQKVTVAYGIINANETKNRNQANNLEKLKSYYTLKPAPVITTQPKEPTPTSTTTPTATAPSNTTTTQTTQLPTNTGKPYAAASCNGNADCIYNSREGYVMRAYMALRGNVADKAGFKGWVSSYATHYGDDTKRVLQDIAGASEFAKLTNEAFVDGLYKNILDRTPDAAGREGWLKLATGAAVRAETIISFTNTSEARTKTNYKGTGKTFVAYVADAINKLYTEDVALKEEVTKAQSDAVVQRYVVNNDANNPQRTAVQTYTATSCQNNVDCMYNSREGKVVRFYYALFGTADLPGVVAHVQAIASSQYNENYNALFSGMKAASGQTKDLDDPRLVYTLYQNLLERNPDTAGARHWTQQFAGTSDGQVVLDFTSLPDVALRKDYKGTGRTFREVVADRVHQLYAQHGARIPQTATHSTAANPQAGSTRPYSATTCNANVDCMYNSREGQVARIYAYITNRLPDSAAIASWNNHLTSHSGGRDNIKITAENMFTANEPRIKSLNTLSVDDYVKDMYSFMAGRQPDPAGLIAWKGTLAKASRAEAAIGFSASNEVMNGRGARVLNGNGKVYKDVIADLIHKAYTDMGGRFVNRYTPPVVVTSTRDVGGGTGVGTTGRGGCAGNQLHRVNSNGPCVTIGSNCTLNGQTGRYIDLRGYAVCNIPGAPGGGLNCLSTSTYRDNHAIFQTETTTRPPCTGSQTPIDRDPGTYTRWLRCDPNNSSWTRSTVGGHLRGCVSAQSGGGAGSGAAKKPCTAYYRGAAGSSRTTPPHPYGQKTSEQCRTISYNTSTTVPYKRGYIVDTVRWGTPSTGGWTRRIH